MRARSGESTFGPESLDIRKGEGGGGTLRGARGGGGGCECSGTF